MRHESPGYPDPGWAAGFRFSVPERGGAAAPLPNPEARYDHPYGIAGRILFVIERDTPTVSSPVMDTMISAADELHQLTWISPASHNVLHLRDYVSGPDGKAYIRLPGHDYVHRFEVREGLSPARERETVIHELAHFYFKSRHQWILEGATEFLTDYALGARSADPHYPCSDWTIHQVETEGSSPCHATWDYDKGSHLFMDLYLVDTPISLDEFNERNWDVNRVPPNGFRDLHLIINHNQGDGIEAVCRAFPTPEHHQVIHKHYGKEVC